MPGVRFVSVSPYAVLGGAVAGTVELEFDRPSKVREISVALVASELSQMTVSNGKNSQVIRDSRVFFEQAVSLRERIPFQDPEHAAPGTYQVPFQFALPAVAPPSLETRPLNEDYGHFDQRPDGMYVDYTLVARVDVPLWIDPLRQHRFPVVPPVRVLGGLPETMSPITSERVQVRVAPADLNAPWISPGKPFSMVYAVQNPGGKTLKGLTATLVRDVVYSVRGRARADRTTFGNFPLEFQGNAPLYEGRMDLMVPDLVGMVNPGMGQLFRCSWSMELDLGVHMGFDLKFAVPLTPPVVNLPAPSPQPNAPPGPMSGTGGP